MGLVVPPHVVQSGMPIGGVAVWSSGDVALGCHGLMSTLGCLELVVPLQMEGHRLPRCGEADMTGGPEQDVALGGSLWVGGPGAAVWTGVGAG